VRKEQIQGKSDVGKSYILDAGVRSVTVSLESNATRREGGAMWGLPLFFRGGRGKEMESQVPGSSFLSHHEYGNRLGDMPSPSKKG